MTPATRLLEAARASTRNASPRENLTERERELLDAVEALSDARALYPAAHAIGKRVSVVYPPGEVGPNFTGKVLSLHVFSDRTIAHVKSDGGPVIAVDSAFVHPAPEPGCIVGARIGADAGIAAGRPVLRDDGEAVGVVVPTATTGAFLINTASSEAQQAAMDAVTSVSPSWFPMDGRRVTEGSPGQITSANIREEWVDRDSIADVQKTTFDPAVHGNTFGCLRLGGHIFDRCQRAADHEGPCVPASKPCPDCGTPPSRPHQPGCPTAAKQW